MTSLGRRAFLRLAGITAATVGAASCAPLGSTVRGTGRTNKNPLTQSERYALRRLCFGATQRETLRVSQIGLAAWIEEQLDPAPLLDLEMRWRLRNLEALEKEADALDGYRRQEVIRQLRQASLLRQIYSYHQLYEMMVEFWTDHFNISVEKGDCWFLKVVDDREVIRAHALGNFPDLLQASARSPAMLVYLDNQANLPEAPNENYAREVLELHTLGIDGGYQQVDIGELARSLTGWTVKDHFWRGRFHFDEELHDHGPKRILDMELPASGMHEVLDFLKRIALHPATARHLAIKLVRRFISDNPIGDASWLVERTQKAFLESGGDIRTTLRPVLLDGLARDSGMLGMKFKRPVDFLVSALRLSSAETDGGLPLHRYLGRMGQAPFAWPTPEGPPDIASHWQANLTPRWNFALRLASGSIAGTTLPGHDRLSFGGAGSIHSLLDELGMAFLGRELPPNLKDALTRAINEDSALSHGDQVQAVIAGLIASPAFQYR